MLDRHRSHLLSTYTTVLPYLADARQVIATDQTPGGGRVAPLAEPLRSDLRADLDAVSSRTASRSSVRVIRIYRLLSSFWSAGTWVPACGRGVARRPFRATWT